MATDHQVSWLRLWRMWTVPTLVWGLGIVLPVLLLWFFSLAWVFSAHARPDQWLAVTLRGNFHSPPLSDSLPCTWPPPWPCWTLNFLSSPLSNYWALFRFLLPTRLPGDSFQAGSRGRRRLPSSVYALSYIPCCSVSENYGVIYFAHFLVLFKTA